MEHLRLLVGKDSHADALLRHSVLLKRCLAHRLKNCEIPTKRQGRGRHGSSFHVRCCRRHFHCRYPGWPRNLLNKVPYRCVCGGCLPRCASSSRIAASGRFMCSAMTVARPVGVIPTTRTPSQRKCSRHASRRGSNNTTSSPVYGSTTVTKRAPFSANMRRKPARDFPRLIVRQRLRARHGRCGKSPLDPSEPGRNARAAVCRPRDHLASQVRAAGS